MSTHLASGVRMTATVDGAVLLDDVTGAFWQLNRSAADVLHALAAGVDQTRIATDLVDRYHIDARRAARDIAALVEQLTQEGLIAS